MKSLLSLKEKILSKPKIVIGLSILFFLLSIFAAIIGFEMYLNESDLIKNNFDNNSQSFYFLFSTVSGISIFFCLLSKGLWNLKEWSRYFILGSSFISSLSVTYYIVVLSYYIIDKNFINIDKQLEMLLLNIVYLIIYLLLIKYFLRPDVEIQFKNKKDLNQDKFFVIHSDEKIN